MKFASQTVLALLAVLGLSSSPAAAEPVKAEVVTSAGKIVVELDADKAPKTVENFLQYAKSGHYAGTIFHRVIPGFMIQGGGLDRNLREKRTQPPVINEAGNGLTNEPYTLAMARTGDPHSATSQFFINVAKNDFLDRKNSRDGFGYAVFGKVIEGKEVVDKIARVATRPAPGGHENVPVEPIVIQEVKILNGK
ncbi:peptidylprolyl isomerase [Candidatus Laterigemmans baculatus]|uniref:peptidylprolyl isomerase n=1 Tax=Candidatus Laterigemmans baculatus TaxID=2770505 RepID=UPI0013DABE0E|nr:peptidylprolyl isomerase [Candidatus Laterigemmans baculatus]